jgi:hypothetical protein
MSRTVIVLVVVGAAIVAVAVGVAWQGKMSDVAQMVHAAKPDAAAPPPKAAPAASPPPAASAPPPAAAAAAPPASTSTSTSPPAAPAAAPSSVPTFDIARIGPDGRAVIAGRAAPGAKVVLLNGGKEIAHGQADSRGEWVLLAQDPPLAAGQHELRVVQHIEGRAPVTSEQVVVAVVPAAPAAASAPKEETLVMIAPKTGPTTLVQPPSAAGVAKSGDLQVSTLDYDERGNVTVTGRSSPGTTVRAYLDDKLVAEGAAGADGRWKLVPAAPVEPGKHTLRLDRLTSDGKPSARLELPFDRRAPTLGEGRRLTIVRGDNLWNIARAHYSEGWRYTVIYEANKDLIQDPHKIYPGQSFHVPRIN